MRLPLGSRALRRRSRLLHPVYRRAPLDGTAGLRNPVSCDPVRERGDKVFGERSSATAGFDIDTEADDYFPNDDFFPDISNLFSDMALNGDNVNAGSSSAPHYSPVSFASSLKPPPFEGVNYKRWRARAILWLTTMRCFDATKGKPEGELTPLEEKAFEDADTLLRGAIISVLGENIVDSYLSISTGKDMWDAIEAKFGVSDAGSELYVMEQFYDFKMTNERSIVEQAHEIQSIAKELEQFTCVLPDKFIAGGIIAKLPPSWRNFATSLKHKRQEFSTTDLIGSLDVEEKARAKDTRARGVEGGSSANLVQKKNFQSYKSKNKNKREMNHIATGTAPSLDGELLPLHGSSSGDEDGGGDGSGVDGEAFRGHFPSGGAGTETPSPDLGFAMAAALEGFAAWLLGVLGQDL
ncbi:hypothetical protein QYE76_023184 [Lolium multiflorum]|uniref:Retrotransposon protein, putative, Ty1-copia subclass n=1 Tax=Lolium multiflorum TaxID=4521 RepID=A0AAD8RCD0_LOLMU|nr:hypothetical protein QYE76_023184 [Lolium multiflorum]